MSRKKRASLLSMRQCTANTEAAAQELASTLCEKGMTNVAVYDVSKTHVSYLVSEAFKYSHIVLASVTYNLKYLSGDVRFPASLKGAELPEAHLRYHRERNMGD